jgi:hypothetical protein
MGVYMLCEHIKREAERENPFFSEREKRNKSDFSPDSGRKRREKPSKTSGLVANSSPCVDMLPA